MTLIQIISSLSIIAVMTVTLSCLYYEKKTGIPSVPTLPWVRKKILEALNNLLDKEENWKMAELGCGWGGINLDLAKNFPNSDITGYEVAFFPYFLSKVRAFLASKRIKIVKKSFFDTDLTGFDTLICYLGPIILERLKPQFDSLKPGTIIISNAFKIPGWNEIETLHTHVGMDIPVYIYRVT